MRSTPPTSSSNRGLLPVALFTLAYLGAATLAAWQAGNREFVFYIVVMALLLGLVYAVHRRVRFTTPLLWALSLWGALHMAGGLVPVPESWPINGDIRVLYSWWLIPERLKYDQVVHAFGFGVTTWACWQALRASLADMRNVPRDDIRPRAGWMVLCAAAGQGFGAMNEVVEFAATKLVPETNVGGYDNTGWDLVANMTGSALAALLIYGFSRAR